MKHTMRRPDQLDGRAAAALAVADVLTGKQFVGETLRSFRTAGRLAPRDAGLAMETAQGTIRHLLTIEHLLATLARFNPEQTKSRLRAILYTAVYQIVWMDRVPPFAAVDQAVELARGFVHGRTPGMANAVLRRVAGAIAERRGPWLRLDPAQIRVSWNQACRFNQPVLPPAHAPVEHLAIATGERPERFADLIERLGSERAEAVAWTSQAVPVTVLYRNPLRTSAAEFVAALRAAFADAVAFSEDDAAAFVPSGSPLLDLPGWSAGLFYVQDTSAHAAARAIQAQPGERILDLCAAPGGKSLGMALAMQDAGELIACDIDAARLARVADNAARLGLTCIRTKLLTAGTTGSVAAAGFGASSDPDFGPEAAFDAALVDVPCSNTGVIARRPEARLGLTPRKLRSVVALQSALLQRAARLVRPGGRLVYSTCSIEPQENEEVVTGFLDEQPDWRLEEQAVLLPNWGPHPPDWRDGGYWARLNRT